MSNSLLEQLDIGDAVLCYIEGPWAFFTTQELSKQWGDDWNDAPYEHNAGWPYAWDERTDKAKKLWKIVRVAFDAELYAPATGMGNSRYSVEMINAGCIPWLASDSHAKNPIAIPAGTTLYDFIERIHKVGGNVFIDYKSLPHHLL